MSTAAVTPAAPAWEQTAVNPQTGQTIGYRGGQWYDTATNKPYQPPAALGPVAPLPASPDTFLSEARKQLAQVGEGFKQLLNTGGVGGPTVGQALLTVGKGLYGTAAGVGNELMGKPQAGRSVLTAPQGIGDRIGGAVDTLIGGDPAAYRAHRMAGQRGAAEADLFAVPVAAAGAGMLGRAFLPARTAAADAKAANMLARASGAAGQSVDMPAAFRTALPELRTTASTLLGNAPVRSLADLSDLVRQTFARTETEFQSRLLPIAQQQTVPLSISQAILNEITPNMTQTAQGRAMAGALRKAAVDYQKPWTLEQLNMERMAATKRLRSVSNASPSSAAAQLHLNVSAMVDKAIEDGAKDIVYGALDRQYAGQVPTGYFENMKRAQSALYDIRDQLEGRMNELSNRDAQGFLGRLRAHSYVSSGGHVGGAIGGISEALYPESKRAASAVRKGLGPTADRRAALAASPIIGARRSQPSLAPDAVAAPAPQEAEQ